MMVNYKPLKPIKAGISSLKEKFMIAIMAVAQIILWLVMIIAGIQVLIFWGYTLISKGMFDSTTVQYSIVVAVGTYVCLIIDRNRIYDSLRIKELPFIHPKISVETKESTKKTR